MGDRQFGGVEQTRQQGRDAQGTAHIDRLIRDSRYAARRLVRDWRFTTAAVLILGLGIGANTAVFSLVNATLLREQSLADPARLVDLYQNAINPGGIDANAYAAYRDIAAHTDVFAGTTAVFIPRAVTYLDQGALRPAIAEHTTASYLSVLGLRPSHGRWFEAGDDTTSAAVVAIVGHDAWMRRFNADPSIVGRTIRIEGVPVTIIGVGPVGHRGTLNLGLVTDFWVPISSLRTFGLPERVFARRPDEAAFFVKARLRDGVTVEQAQAAMNILASRFARQYPQEDPGKGITVVASSEVRIHPQMDGLLTAVASALLCVVGLVLAIACSNLATLLLVRGSARVKEISVRLALGASRGQIVRQLLTESLLLSAAGCVAGCIMAWWSIRSLTMWDLPIAVDVNLDYRVLAYAAVVSLVTGLASGLAPALQTTKVDLVSTLRASGEAPSRQRGLVTLKNALVALQVATSVALLGGTTVFIQMLSASRSANAGFAVDGIAMLETDPRYAGGTTAQASDALEELRRRIAAVPGVQSTVLTRGVPMEAVGTPVVVEGEADTLDRTASRFAGAIWAGPGYFDLLSIPILFGRAFDERDRPDTPRVAVISETMARQYFGTGGPADAIGRRFRLPREADSGGWIEVVGVARDTGTADPHGDLIDPTPQLFYRSFTQSDDPPTTVLARTALDAASLVVTMQRELRAVHAGLPAVSARTMAQHLEESLAVPKAAATFLGALGVLGASLAGIGLYAVVAFSVARRTREIGIRMALGARRRQAVGTVMREVALLVSVGTGAGLIVTVLAVLALGTVRVATPGITMYRPALAPVALLAVAVLMALVGAAAAFVPARRAARIDPLRALRTE